MKLTWGSWTFHTKYIWNLYEFRIIWTSYELHVNFIRITWQVHKKFLYTTHEYGFWHPCLCTSHERAFRSIVPLTNPSLNCTGHATMEGEVTIGLILSGDGYAIIVAPRTWKTQQWLANIHKYFQFLESDDNCQISNISRVLEGNTIVDHSEVVGRFITFKMIHWSTR